MSQSKPIRPLPSCLAFVALLFIVGAARGQELTYSGSLQYSTGRYLFTERTSSAYLVSSLAVRASRIQLSGSLPFIYQSTPWISYTAGGTVPTGGPEQGAVGDSLRRRTGGGGPMGTGGAGGTASSSPTRGTTSRSPRLQMIGSGERVALPDTSSFEQVGLGDPTFRLGVELIPPERSAFTATLTGEVKIPLADPDRGFGTGEWDGGGLLSLGQRIGGTLLFADLGYWVLGDMPDLPLENPVSYSVGIGRRMGAGNVAVLASLSGYSRILAETDPPLEVGAGISYGLGEGRSLSMSVSVGLSESSPDLSVAAGWRTRL